MTITEEPIPGESVPQPQITIDQMIGRYLKLRDRIKESDDAHKAKLKPAREFLEKMNNEILNALNQTGGESIKTALGTAYRSEKKSASTEDAQLFRDFIVANELFDMVDWKPNVNAVADYIAEMDALPPGVKFSTVFVVGVRRPGEK